MEIALECMKTSDIKSIILKDLCLEEVHVLLFEKHYQIIAIDSMFLNISMLEAHKMIYAPLLKYILNNKIHSVSIKVFNPEEWNIKRQLFNL